MPAFNSNGVAAGVRLSGFRKGFSLVELMVATSILVFMLLMVVGMIQMTNSVWSRSNAQAQAFQGARNAFETISRSLGQSTLNTYWGRISSHLKISPHEHCLNHLLPQDLRLIRTKSPGFDGVKMEYAHCIRLRLP